MVMVWVWVQIRRKMLGYGLYTSCFGLTSSTCVNPVYVKTWKFVTLQAYASTNVECGQEVLKEYEERGIREDSDALAVDLKVGDNFCVRVHLGPRTHKINIFPQQFHH
jgi:hypothetical protein